MKIVHFQGAVTGSVDSPEWLRWRAGGIGASDAAIIAFNAGLLPASEAQSWQKGYAALLSQKRGETVGDEAANNFAAKRGKALEASVLKMVSERTGIPFAPAFGEMDDHQIIRSSFDGITFDHECIAEIKVGSKKVHEAALSGVVISHYRPQVAHQALTAWGPPESWRNDACTFFANFNDGFDVPLAIVEVPSSTEWLKTLAQDLLPIHLAFWKEVEQGRAIPAEVLETVAKLKRLKAEADAANAALDVARSDLIGYVDRIGVPKFEANGVLLTKTHRKGVLDYGKAFKALGIDEGALERYRKEGGTTWTLKVA